MLNYTLFQPVGVCALISPWNVPFMTATWKVAPCLALRQHRGAEDERAVAADRDAPGRAGTGGRRAAGRAERRARLRQDRGRAAVRAPRRARDLVHRLAPPPATASCSARGSKKFIMELGGKSPFVVFDDADLERALDAAVFMIFSQQRRALHRRLAHPRPAHDLRPTSSRRSPSARGAPRRRRPARREDDHRPDDQPRSTSPRCAATSSSGPTEGATLLSGGLDAPPAARRGAQGQLRASPPCSPTSTTACDRAGRDLRAGGVPDPVRRRGRRDRASPTTSGTACRQLRVDREPRPRAPRGRSHRGRHVLRQQPERARPAPAVRRHQGLAAPGARAAPGASRCSSSRRTSACRIGDHPIPRWGV